MAKGKHGTRLYGVPPDEDMREARRRQRFMAVSGDPDIGACRVAIENIAAARGLKAYRGRPLNTGQLLTALAALEQARVPLRDYAGAPAVSVVAKRLKVNGHAAQSLLRRLVHLRNRLEGR
ncbi:MAG: hypothetical protein ACREFK_02170 [Stellaceae bacterium]